MLKVFDAGALPYDLLTAQDDWRASVRRMAGLLPAEPIRRGLDLGAGPGTSTLALAGARPEARWVAADISLVMLVRAKRRIGAGIDVAAADALALPFRDGSFDAVMAHSLLYLVPSREAALREVVRVLAPGGTFVYLEPSPRFPLRSLAAFVLANALSPRFAASMVAWRVAAAVSGRRIAPEASMAVARAAGFADADATATLGGLGYFVRARTAAKIASTSARPPR